MLSALPLEAGILVSIMCTGIVEILKAINAMVKYWISAVCIFLPSTEVVGQETLEPLRSVSEVEQWEGEQRPVDFTATVTYSDPDWGLLFVRVGQVAGFVPLANEMRDAKLGSVVRIQGRTSVNQRGKIVDPVYTLESRGPPPVPLAVDPQSFSIGAYGSEFISVEAKVESIVQTVQWAYLNLSSGGQEFDLYVPGGIEAGNRLARLPGSRIKISGCVGSMTTRRRSIPILYTQSTE